MKKLLLFFLLFLTRIISAQEKPKILDFTVNGVSFQMVLVEGGRFMMGNTIENDFDSYSDESPMYRVTLSDFYIGKLEVTQELWRAVMNYNPSHFRAYKNPVETVSWNDCQLFIDSLNKILGLNFRLPTEAEWEYAARGGKYSKGYKFSGSNNLDQVAWYEKTTKEMKHHGRAGTTLPNELGIYDMSGNVWEWCVDYYTEYDKNPKTNPMNITQGTFRVLRGGAWNGIARSCRCTNRSSYFPDHKSFYYGFRLAIYK